MLQRGQKLHLLDHTTQSAARFAHRATDIFHGIESTAITFLYNANLSETREYTNTMETQLRQAVNSRLPCRSFPCQWRVVFENDQS